MDNVDRIITLLKSCLEAKASRQHQFSLDRRLTGSLPGRR